MKPRLAVSALFLANGALLATWVSRLPAVQSARSLSHGQIGLALLAMAAGAFISMPLSGAWSGRLGTRRICGLAGVAYAALLPTLWIWPGRAGLAIGLFAFGCVHGALDVAMNAEAVAEEKRHGRPIMASFHALFSLGGLLGAAAGGIVAGAGIATPWHFLGAAIVCGSLIAWASMRLSVAGGLSRGGARGPHARFDVESATAGVSAPGYSASARSRKTRTAIFEPLILALGLIAFCSMIGEGAMADWSALFLRDVRQASDGTAAWGYACFSVTMAFGRVLGDRLIARFGPGRMLRAGAAAAAAGLAAAVALPSAAATMVGFGLAGLGFSTIVPIVFSAAGRVRGRPAAESLAAVSTTGYLGFLAGPPAIGLIASAIGLRWALGVVVATSAAGIALAGWVDRAGSPERRHDKGLTTEKLARIPAAQ
ncbi:MAG TPA: MFS transporter [Opitutaceae bacterium]